MKGGETKWFVDGLPAMGSRLGGEGLMKELCKGFRVLMDERKGVITVESLRRKSHLLGLKGMEDKQLILMLREGDLDGDGVISEMEFCVLMFRLSPHLMKAADFWLREALLMEWEGSR